MFTSNDKRIAGFLRMARLLSFLEGSGSKQDKVAEIKMAVADGVITEDEAVELVIEFC